MFVFPEDNNVGQSLIKRGSLLVINALQEDSGKYECHTVVQGADFSEVKITSIFQVCNTLKLFTSYFRSYQVSNYRFFVLGQQ